MLRYPASLRMAETHGYSNVAVGVGIADNLLYKLAEGIPTHTPSRWDANLPIDCVRSHSELGAYLTGTGTGR